LLSSIRSKFFAILLVPEGVLIEQAGPN